MTHNSKGVYAAMYMYILLVGIILWLIGFTIWDCLNHSKG